MRMRSPLFLLFCHAAYREANGFSFAFPKVNAANPSIKKFTDAQTGVLLNLRLDVGRERESRLLLDGLVVELTDCDAPKNHPKLPGANGPNPKISGGAHALKTLDDAYFIGMDGRNTVALDDGCWEMVWRDNAPAGTIVCGFRLPNDVRRNAATLPKGRLYISFPVWTKDGLALKQADKREAEDAARQHMEDQGKEIAKMTNTDNLLMKALHYRNAVAATEKINMSGLHGRLGEVPSDDDVVSIQNDLLLCNKGTIWTKGGSFLGADHVLLGVATVSADMPPAPTDE